jgi:hypothetical protein
MSKAPQIIFPLLLFLGKKCYFYYINIIMGGEVMTCQYCGSYKPATVKVCCKCDNNPKLAAKLKGASCGVKSSLCIDENGKVTKKVLGR